MDKVALEQYSSLRVEYQDLQDEIKKLEKQIRKMETSRCQVSDSVKGTRPDGTYGSITITGFPVPDYYRRLQDLVHAMEFAVDKSERNRVATKLQQSRKYRRQNKDIVKRNERIVKFFEEQKNRDTLNRMRQLLGQQRKEEEYLDGERAYKPRVGKG